MTLSRRIGLGFTLGVDATGGSSFTLLGSIVDGWKEGAAKAKTADITILSDLYEQMAKGQINPGSISFSVAYDPDDGTTALMVTLLKQLLPPPNWQISYPSGTQGAGIITTEPFLAHLTSMGREVKKDKFLTCEIELTKTGAPGFHGN